MTKRKAQPKESIQRVRLSKHQGRVMTALVRERERLQRDLQGAVGTINEQIKEYAKGYKLNPEWVKVEGDEAEVWLVETQPAPEPSPEPEPPAAQEVEESDE